MIGVKIPLFMAGISWMLCVAALTMKGQKIMPSWSNTL